MKKSIFVLVALFSVFAAIGHSGRTDSNGGHYDRKTGTYHYHGTSKSRSEPSPSSSKSRIDNTPIQEPAPQRAVTQPVITRPVVVPSETQKAETEAKTIAWQTKQAEAGSASAQFDLGSRYLTGNGVEKDLEKAISLLEQAATAGHPQAQKKLDEALREVVPVTVQPLTPADAKDLERLTKENELLRKENQDLRRLLANGGKATTETPVSTPAPAITSINNPASSPPTTPATSKCTISSTGKRHNSSCRYYSSGRPCGANEGIACKICGG